MRREHTHTNTRKLISLLLFLFLSLFLLLLLLLLLLFSLRFSLGLRVIIDALLLMNKTRLDQTRCRGCFFGLVASSMDSLHERALMRSTCLSSTNLLVCLDSSIDAESSNCQGMMQPMRSALDERHLSACLAFLQRAG